MNPLFTIFFSPQFISGVMIEVQRAWLKDMGWLK